MADDAQNRHLPASGRKIAKARREGQVARSRDLSHLAAIAVYGLVNSDVFKDFPSLKIICSHGGGAVPYQIGRFQSSSIRKPGGQRFIDGLKKMYFDTVLYSEGGLKLLIDLVGPERCLFGAECPGVGSAINPDTGGTFDDIRPIIESFDWLSAAQKKLIFEDNARRLFRLPA